MKVRQKPVRLRPRGFTVAEHITLLNHALMGLVSVLQDHDREILALKRRIRGGKLKG